MTVARVDRMCAVAPSPELRERLRTALRDARTASGLPADGPAAPGPGARRVEWWPERTGPGTEWRRCARWGHEHCVLPPSQHDRRRRRLAAAGVAVGEVRPRPRMTGVVLAGLLAGWAVAVPVGPVGACLVGLAARAGWRTGAAAALGVAAADGAFALLAALGGAGLAQVVRPVAGPLRVVGAAVLLALAVRGAVVALRGARTAHEPTALAPRRAFVQLLALTLVNPSTLLVFAALVVGSGGALAASPAAAVVFATAATLASAAWQLLLAGAGAALGGVLTGRRGRLGTALVSSAVMAVLAVALVLPRGAR